MFQRSEHPKIKLSLTITDWIIEIIGFAFLVIMIVIPLIHFKELPDRIPTHFNSSGQPDDYGSKLFLGIFPLAGFILYLLLTVLSYFPHLYNFPVKITPENVRVQYRLATRLLRVLKTLIIIMYSYLNYMTVKTATGAASGLGKSFLPISLTLVFGVIVYYIVQSLNNRQID